MSEQVVIVDVYMEIDNTLLWFQKEEKDFKKKYGLHVERVVKYLVEEKFVSILMFLRPKGSSVV